MEPVRVKLYGLFSVTKARYLTQQAFAVAVTLLMLVAWVAIPRLPPATLRDPSVDIARDPAIQEQFRQIEKIHRVVESIPLIVAALLGAIVLESAIVLRLFARKEAVEKEAADKQKAEASPPKTDGTVENQPTQIKAADP
jgi:hypothetical protein